MSPCHREEKLWPELGDTRCPASPGPPLGPRRGQSQRQQQQCGHPGSGLSGPHGLGVRAGSGRLGRQWDLEARVARSKRSRARGGDRRRGGAGGPGEPRTRAGQDTGPSGARAASLGILSSSSGCGAQTVPSSAASHRFYPAPSHALSLGLWVMASAGPWDRKQLVALDARERDGVSAG